ncbi:sodium/potassium/calcium exchanger 6, mitochondrial-like isoform X3 [Sinocyclocheilus anshuiensis]|uniref:Sodium/potassium/calcium exchanger 6, mitochondrial-like n=1 Tax=Sinocyclocheilus anshuiensis TaxID=1608454 RepID=A0A671RZH2_9TELE|nr:PREDICTED: sodium/potassium/calcium exchanger 6, mitochondrial-like isoform X3 [Sinocyclocheilus anshuiensis]
MRALLLVLFCTVALQWDRVSCQKTVYQSNTHLVPHRNVWRSDRPAEGTPNRNGDECDVVMNLSASQRCEFVKNTPDCASDEGFIKYPVVTFCLFPPNLLPLAITLYVLWLFVLFLVLGLIASDFFCPNLSAISSTLRLTHNVAGVTFLALGNGAPDVFSAMAAFSHPQTAGLAIGALFGYLGLYIAYVLTVIVSAYIYNRQKHQLNGSAQTSGREQGEILPSDSYREIQSASIQAHDDGEYEPLLPYTQSTAQIFLNAINPVDSRTWRRQHWSAKVLKVIKVPVEVLLLLTVPVVDADKEDHNWKRPLNCLHIITGPVVCVLSFQSGKYGLLLIEGEVPVWVLILCIGVFLSGIVFFTTTNERPPRYHFLYSLLGFVVSMLWISTVASEIVSVLHLLGVVLSLSNTVLGLTLLAWGNSIGDCFADITIARQGYPRMAISACFGGIIFNMLFGVGLGCLLQIFQTNNVVMLEPEGMLCWVLSGALGLSLVLSFILVPLQCFHLSRVYGIFLLIFYIVFLLVALLTEFRVIQF